MIIERMWTSAISYYSSVSFYSLYIVSIEILAITKYRFILMLSRYKCKWTMCKIKNDNLRRRADHLVCNYVYNC